MTVIRTVASVLVACTISACASSPAPPDTSLAPAPLAAAAKPAPAPEPPAPVVLVPAQPLAAAPVSVPEAVPVPAPTPAPKVATAPPAPVKSAPSQEKRPPATPVATKPVEPAKAPATSVTGTLELVPGGRDAIVAGEVADGLVYFLPKTGGPPPKAGTFTVETRTKGFSPAVLVVPVGSTVRFPNRDTILHNVFSRSAGNTFDSGLYGPGQVRQQVFAKPGLVIVNCNVHHNMRADVVVLATPHFTRPDRSGRYTLAGLPSGAGTLVFWHPRAQAQSVQVTLPMQGAVTRKLTATRPSRHAGMAGH